tara:strand:- start:1475 stop:2161 length:687 start_codon:yes stop_codon:yes gene_type:complete
MKKKTAGRIIGAKLSFSNKITKILDKYGNQKIRSIYIGRRPINSLVEKAFNIISLGKWSKLRDQYYYDKLFHLFLIIQMDDDTVISFEKNSIVTMTEDDVRCSTKDTECVKLDYPTDSITLDDLVRKPLERIGKEKYFIYDPFKQNCQIFIRAVLETFGLYNKKVDDFVYQDITDIVKELPWYVKYVAKGVTDLDATISKVSGAGKEPDKQEDLEILTNFVTEMLQSK